MKSKEYFELDLMASKLFKEFHDVIDALDSKDNEAKKNLLGAFVTLQEHMVCLEFTLAPTASSREYQRLIATEVRNGILQHNTGE